MKRNNPKHDKILNAAYTLFLERGYWDTKIIDIADAAGIGKGTVYEYFESKDAIFFELFRTKVAAVYETLTELTGKKISGEEKLAEYLELEMKNSSKHLLSKTFLVDFLMNSDAFRNPALMMSAQKLVMKKFTVLRDIIRDGIKDGEFRDTDPSLAALLVMGAIHFFICARYLPFDCPALDSESCLSLLMAIDLNSEEFMYTLMRGLKI